MQGTQLRSLVWEDSTCLRAARLVHQNYWARLLQLLKPETLEPALCSSRSPPITFYYCYYHYRHTSFYCNPLYCASQIENGMATHSSILAWRIPWLEEPGELQSMGSQRVAHDWSNWACTHMLRRYCVFYGLKVCGNPGWNKSTGIIFPTAFAHCVTVTFW